MIFVETKLLLTVTGVVGTSGDEWGRVGTSGDEWGRVGTSDIYSYIMTTEYCAPQFRITE